jgi:hypothetical protein
MKHRIETIHHQNPTSRGGANNEINKRLWNKTLHEAWHILHTNELVHEAILKIMNWNSSIIEQPAIEEIEELFRQKIEDRVFYKHAGFRSNYPSK